MAHYEMRGGEKQKSAPCCRGRAAVFLEVPSSLPFSVPHAIYAILQARPCHVPCSLLARMPRSHQDFEIEFRARYRSAHKIISLRRHMSRQNGSKCRGRNSIMAHSSVCDMLTTFGIVVATMKPDPTQTYLQDKRLCESPSITLRNRKLLH